MRRASVFTLACAAVAGCVAPKQALVRVEDAVERVVQEARADVDDALARADADRPPVGVGEPRPDEAPRLVHVTLRASDRRGWKRALVAQARDVFAARVDLDAAPWEWSVDVWLWGGEAIAFEATRAFEPDEPLFAAKAPDGGFYDATGASLDGPCLARALDYAYVSSLRGPRVHPVTGRHRMHHGTDYAARIGTPVVAVADGVVKRVGVDKYKGLHVLVKHDNGLEAKYFHLDEVEPGVLAPKRVVRGERLGRVGMTGLATGPHLHLELSWKGRALDPTTMRWPGGRTLSPEHQDAHRVLVEALRAARGGDVGPAYALLSGAPPSANPAGAS